jgi:hypothetical protein
MAVTTGGKPVLPPQAVRSVVKRIAAEATIDVESVRIVPRV